MRYLNGLSLLLLLLSLSCGAGQSLSGKSPLRVTPLHDSELTGLKVVPDAAGVTLELDHVAAMGTYFQLTSDAGMRLQPAQQELPAAVLSLIIPVADGAVVGLAPTASYAGAPVRLRVDYSAGPRTVSVPPVGAYNQLVDFAVADAGGGQVTLSWTQVNTGDYNFDGLVGISDLTPVGQLYQHKYQRGAAGAELTREYWVDGNTDGEINISDVTPIGQNYGAFIAGYNLRHNGSLIPGATAGEPSVPASQANPRTGLPPTYTVTLSGLAADAWTAVAVDQQGTEGSGSGGVVGSVDLRANITLTGLDLIGLQPGDPGANGTLKIGTRVIDPIEIIDSARVQTPSLGQVSVVAPNQLDIGGLPRQRTLYLDVIYNPTVSLATGAPKGAATAKGARATDPAELVVSSIPFRLPAGSELVVVNGDIQLSPNPAGGYFVDLDYLVEYPGDNPLTPAIEAGYTKSARIRLAYASGLVSDDTDLNGDWEDEAQLIDADLDCISHARGEQEFDDDEYEHGSRTEFELEGFISSFNESAGLITLTGVTVEGGAASLPDPLTLQFSELTQFEERVKTGGDDFERDLDPSQLTAGDKVEVSLYQLDDTAGGLPAKYWIEKIKRRIED